MEDKKIIYKCITFALASIMLIILFITTSGKKENKNNTVDENNLSQESQESFNMLTDSLNSNNINSLNITYDEYGNPYYQIEQYEDFTD